jgi:hypothetical protein
MYIKYKNIMGLTLLSLCLFIPFGLSFISGLEPYPAVILPGGAGKIKIDGDDLRFSKLVLYGKDQESDQWKSLDATAFLDPIPVVYLRSIIVNEFGLNRDRVVSVNFAWNLFPDFDYTNQKFITEERVVAAKAWLRERLALQGCETDTLLARKVIVKSHVITKTNVETGIAGELYFNLH